MKPNVNLVLKAANRGECLSDVVFHRLAQVVVHLAAASASWRPCLEVGEVPAEASSSLGCASWVPWMLSNVGDGSLPSEMGSRVIGSVTSP